MPADQRVMSNETNVLVGLSAIIGCFVSVGLRGELFFEVARLRARAISA